MRGDTVSTDDRLTTAQAARRLGIGAGTLRRWARDGIAVNGRLMKLPSHPAGSEHYRFDPAEVDAFAEAIRAARGMATATGIGPRPETPAEFARRAEQDVAAMNAALGRN